MGGGFRVLHLVRPFLSFLLRFSQLPLYGIHSTTVPIHLLDACYSCIKPWNCDGAWNYPIADIWASDAALGWVRSLRWTTVSEDRALLNGAQKLLGILIAVGEAVAYVLSGMYGSVGQLGVGECYSYNCSALFLRIIVICLDELLQKGYGLGSGISFHSNQHLVGYKCFYRQNLPNVTNLLFTVLIFLIVIYFQGFRVVLPVRRMLVDNRAHIQLSFLHLQHAHHSSICPCFQSSFISHFTNAIQEVHGNFLVNLLGKWKESEYSGGQYIPVGGLAYYVTAPASQSIPSILSGVYAFSLCLFSKTWIEVSGSSARDVAKQLKTISFMNNGETASAIEPCTQLHDHEHKCYCVRICGLSYGTTNGDAWLNSNLQKELNSYIPTAAAFGGICIGALTVLADFMEQLAQGTGYYLLFTIIYQVLRDIREGRPTELASLASKC
ncbi:Protein transport protein Sec61 subunit alpha [Fagus crenata]